MKKFLMTLTGLLLAFDAVAWEWAYSEEELKNNVGALMCAPEVQRQTLQNTVNTVGVLLESEIFDGQDQLRKRFATIAQMKNDSGQRDAFLGLVGVSSQSEEGLMIALSRFAGARSYGSYIDAIENNVGVTLTPVQRREISGGV